MGSSLAPTLRIQVFPSFLASLIRPVAQRWRIHPPLTPARRAASTTVICSRPKPPVERPGSRFLNVWRPLETISHMLSL